MVLFPFEVVPPVMVSERKKAMTCMDCATVAVTPKSTANAAVTAASGAPQEVKFTSNVNSPVRLTASLGQAKHQDPQLGFYQKMVINSSVLPTINPWCMGTKQAETRISLKETKPSVPTRHAFVLESLLQEQTQTTTVRHKSFDDTRLTPGGEGP